MKKFFRLLITTLLPLTLWANTILISDIDDTIKISHIRSTTGTIGNALRTKNIFKGMADVYQAIARDSNAKIFYLSNAPKTFMSRLHSKLLRNGNFPKGELLLRPSGVTSSEHKPNTLFKIINKEAPTRVILLGDNGERDNVFYYGIQKKFPNIEFLTFIRIAYDLDPTHSPMTGQLGFISPFEIANALYKENILTRQSTSEIFTKHGPDFLKDKMKKDKGRIYLPKWLRCKGHTTLKTLTDFSHVALTSIKNKIREVCSL